MAKSRCGPCDKMHAVGEIPRTIGKSLFDFRDNDAKFFVKERVERVSKTPAAKGWQD